MKLTMNFLQICLIFWSCALIIGALVPFIREQRWWLRAWTYARLQMLMILSITALIYAVLFGGSGLLNAGVLVALLAAALTCLWDIYPFTKLGFKQTRDLKAGENHHAISLFVGNVLMDNDGYEPYLAQIKETSPDLIFLVETNDRWREALSELEDIYPHKYLLPREDYNGMMFYSRHEILGVQERYLVQDHIPSLTIDIDVEEREPLRFYGVHPRPPRPEDDPADLDNELLFIANEAGHHLGPIIVTGDLNDVGWSSTTKKFLRISGLKDPRLGRGLYNSYNAKNPFVRWPLDHVFHSRHFALIDMTRLKALGSDHFPLLIQFALHKE